MKTGITYECLETKVNDTAVAAEDFIIAGNDLEMAYDLPSGKFQLLNETSSMAFDITNVAHDQFAYRLGIPRSYYRKMLDSSAEGDSSTQNLLTKNVNHWLPQSKNHMVRTLTKISETSSGDCRALLSDRYRRIDNHEVLTHIMPMIRKDEFKIASCEITPFNMYLKITFPNNRGDVDANVGDVIETGVIIRNSEVGWGSCSIQLFVHRLVCTNGMVVPDKIWSARKNHSGVRLESDASGLIVSPQTQKLENELFFSAFVDVIEAARSPDTVEKIVQRFTDAKNDKMTKSQTSVPAVQKLAKTLLITEAEQSDLIQHFFADGEMNRWGFANAITRTAQDAHSYERATELEKIGGNVIAMTDKAFSRMSNYAVEA